MCALAAHAARGGESGEGRSDDDGDAFMLEAMLSAPLPGKVPKSSTHGATSGHGHGSSGGGGKASAAASATSRS